MKPFSILKSITTLLMFVICMATVHAQEVDTNALLEQLRWKSQDRVREQLGTPESIRGPIGTHATYQVWQYPDFSIAFANNRVFHVFAKDSLHKLELLETR